MDYSKWKKILIIVSIINLLFTIYNKVFASYEADINNTKFTFSNEFIEASPYFALFTYDTNNALLIRSTQPIKYKYVVNGNLKQYSFAGTINNDYKIKNNFGTLSQISNIVSGSSFTDLSSLSGNGNRTFNISNSTILEPVFANNNLFDYDTNEIIYNSSLYKSPQFDQSDTEIQSLDFDRLFINPYDFGIENKLYFKVLEVTKKVTAENPKDNIYYFNDTTYALNKKSKYIKQFLDTDTYYYSIPRSALKLKKDTSYYFVLTSNNNIINNYIGEIHENEEIFDVCLADTTDIVTTDEEILNAILNNNPSDNTNNTINNNLPRPSFSDENNNINIPGMNVNIPSDTTTDGFNYLFNMIYSQINPTNNVDPAQDIVFNIPFVNKELIINKDFTRNLLGYDSPIITLLSIIYYFLVSYYIIQDIRKTIESVKTGDIMTHTDTNIKADML